MTSYMLTVNKNVPFLNFCFLKERPPTSFKHIDFSRHTEITTKTQFSCDWAGRLQNILKPGFDEWAARLFWLCLYSLSIVFHSQKLQIFEQLNAFFLSFIHGPTNTALMFSKGNAGKHLIKPSEPHGELITYIDADTRAQPHGKQDRCRNFKTLVTPNFKP